MFLNRASIICLYLILIINKANTKERINHIYKFHLIHLLGEEPNSAKVGAKIKKSFV